MSQVTYLSLGSNLGDRRANLAEAITRLEELGQVSKVSSMYETEPVEYTTQPWFINCAVELRTALTPAELIARVLEIERQMGRTRESSGVVKIKGPRLIDIDVLLVGREIIDAPGMRVPHPALHTRRFVLEPLAEIAPEAMHPELNLNVRELLNALRQPAGEVRKLL